ncbi:MAG: hypothetical protein ACAI38_13420 [Myxococcota bacterium]
MMTPSPINGLGQLPPLACSPAQDAACGLEYATHVLETDGFADVLAASEAPRLVQAAGAQLISHAVLRAQIDDAARVVATDPASAPAVERVRQSLNALVAPPREPIPSRLLEIAVTLGGVLGAVFGMLPFLGFIISPWLLLGVIAIPLVAYVLQLYNQSAVTRSRGRATAEHEDAILALLRRADEIRALMAARARQAAHVTLDAPAM